MAEDDTLSLFKLSPDELRRIAESPAPPPREVKPAESPDDTSQSVFRMSPERLRQLATSQDPEPEDLNRRLGHIGGGFNESILGTLGLPMDAVQGVANAGRRLYDYSTGSKTPEFSGWPGTSEGLLHVYDSAIGRTQPQDPLDRILKGIGGGLGAAASGYGIGGALNAAGRAPTIAAALMGGSPTTYSRGLNVVSNLTGGAGGGAGSVVGGDVMDKLSGNNPFARMLGEQIGGLAGGVTGSVMPAAGTVVAQGADRILKPFSAASEQIAGRDVRRGDADIAGDILNRSIVDRSRYGRIAPGQQAPQPLGIEPTTAQITNDPGWLRLERSVKSFDPAIGGAFDDQMTRNNQLVRDALPRVGDTVPGRTPGEVSSEAAPLLEENRQAARRSERDAWESVDPSGTLRTDMQPIRDRMQSFVSNLEMIRRQYLPQDIVEMLSARGQTGQSESFRELAAIRSDLLGRVRAADRAGNFNQANVLRNLDEAVFPGGEVPLPPGADRATQQRYEAARQESRAYNDTFNVSPTKKLFQAGAYDSAALDTALAPGRGQAERVQQYVNASMADPELHQHARDWFATKLNDHVSASITQDNAGNQLIKPTVLGDFVRSNRDLINSSLFTPEQRRVVNDMVEAMRTIGRKPPAEGSPTAANLAGGNYVQALVGEWTKPLSGLVGGVASLVPGMGGASNLLPSLYSGAGERVKNLLGEAMRDPAFASELLMRASRQNNAFVSPKLQGMLATAPLISGGNADLPVRKDYGGPNPAMSYSFRE